MMDEFFYPNLGVRCNFDVWEERGRPDMLSRATDMVQSILSENEQGILDPDLIAQIARPNPGVHNA